MDLPGSEAWLVKFKKKHPTADILEISCLSGDGLEKLKKELLKRVGKFRQQEKASPVKAA